MTTVSIELHNMLCFISIPFSFWLVGNILFIFLLECWTFGCNSCLQWSRKGRTQGWTFPAAEDFYWKDHVLSVSSSFLYLVHRESIYQTFSHCLCQGIHQNSWRGRVDLLHNWWISLQVNHEWMMLKNFKQERPGVGNLTLMSVIISSFSFWLNLFGGFIKTLM